MSQHPFQPGLFVSVYAHPYMLGVRLGEVIEYQEAGAVLLLWQHGDIESIVPERNTRKGIYGCHILLGRGVVDYAVHEKLAFAVGLTHPSMIFVGSTPYYTLDYSVTPGTGFDRSLLVEQLKMHARAERELLRTWAVPVGEVVV